MERRFTPGGIDCEARADGTRQIGGYAAVFHREGDEGTEFRLWDDVFERIDKRAFDRALADSDDARALFNHDSNHLLGRASAGTLRLSADERGLKYDITLPDTQAGRDVATSIERGDLTGSSFAFQAEKVRWEDGENRSIRVIESVRLYDVGPVTYPAYEATSTALRSIRDEYDAWLMPPDTADFSAESIKIRQRLVAIT